MTIGKIKNRLKFGLPVAMMSLGVSLIAYVQPVNAQPDAGEEPKRVYDNIPANWDYYRLTPELLGKYSGEEVEQIVFYDDLVKPPLEYQTVRMTRNQEFAVLQGAKSFVVISTKHIIIGTANTGVNIIKTRGCRESLRRAKYVLLNMEKPNHRYRRGKYINIMTRYNGGLKSCRIDSIHEWKGPVDLAQLKAEDKAVMTKSRNGIQPATEPFWTSDGRPVQ